MSIFSSLVINKISFSNQLLKKPCYLSNINNKDKQSKASIAINL
jgi:hypothetical protein